jgi:predicted O-methyltransferase YrrM
MFQHNTIELTDYLTQLNYNWTYYKTDIAHICELTKTRHDPQMGSFKFSYGMEQVFLLHAIALNKQCTNFVEIGTGRGTACYAVSMINTVKKIFTYDIVNFKEKKTHAINYKNELISNEDIYNRINLPTKRKISFNNISNPNYKIDHKDFDIAFIDGNHTDHETITKDFDRCLDALTRPSLILFDDYHPDHFVVNEVVDDIVSSNGYNTNLITFHGHLFPPLNQEKVKDHGLIIMQIP